jgi:hypothetical protein
MTQKKLTKLKYIFLILMDNLIPEQGPREKYDEERHPLVHYFSNLALNFTSEDITQIKDLLMSIELSTTVMEENLSIINQTLKNSK